MANLIPRNVAMADDQEKAALVERLGRKIENACQKRQIKECSTKKCLKDVNPIKCFQDIMATQTFEERIQDHKNLCDLGESYECGVYCGMIDRLTEFCDSLTKKTQTLTPESHLTACKSGILYSCEEYCRLTVKKTDPQAYSKDLMDCELKLYKK